MLVFNAYVNICRTARGRPQRFTYHGTTLRGTARTFWFLNFRFKFFAVRVFALSFNMVHIILKCFANLFANRIEFLNEIIVRNKYPYRGAPLQCRLAGNPIKDATGILAEIRKTAQLHCENFKGNPQRAVHISGRKKSIQNLHPNAKIANLSLCHQKNPRH